MRHLPLRGTRVMTTRAASQGADLRAALEDLGATVSEVPSLAIGPAPDREVFAAALAALGPEDWLGVTSPNGARAVAAHPFAARVAAVGPGTAAALREAGIAAAHVAAVPDGLGLAASLAAAGSLGGRAVLLARGDLASRDLPDALRAAGADVREVVAYTTIAPPDLGARLAEALAEGEPDWVAIASGSAFANLHAAWPGVMACRLAVIGPRTREAVERAGGVVAAEAGTPDAAGLADAIARTASR